jgi:aryl-alcohol dehydrogenase-like predicted oxidoreductase
MAGRNLRYSSPLRLKEWLRSKLQMKTQQGQSASGLGLATQYLKENAIATAAFEAGINYFFFYDLPSESLLAELRSLLAANREAILIATGSESRDLDELRQYLDRVCRSLDIETVDLFFAEYLSPADDPETAAAALQELHTWKEKGRIRYVGASTHSRSIGLQIVKQRQCDVLMHRYNMAHRQAEVELLPTAEAAGIPVVAFTCTRWRTLLEGHPAWTDKLPTAADCYKYVLHHAAVHLALTAPATQTQLAENLAALHHPELTVAEVTQWQAYGDLIYGSGQDAFETRWQ